MCKIKFEIIFITEVLKMKKRALALFTALAMALSAMPVFAENFEWEATVSDTEVQVGDVFYLDLDILDNPGINNATIHIVYNPVVVKPTLTTVPAEDLISYEDDFGESTPLFSFVNVDGRVNATDLETGTIRFGNYVAIPDENNTLKEATGSGTLLRLYFEAVGEGDADLDFGQIISIKSTAKRGLPEWAYDIDIPTVTVSGYGGSSGSSTANENTTTTEVTTKASNSDSSSNNSTTTVTEATTQATTQSVTEAATEATTAATDITPSNATFTDLSNYPWAVEYINTLAQAGVVNGYNDNTFKPGNNVKRADFIIMLLKAMGVDTTTTPHSNFSDVRVDKYYYNAVGLAKDMGIASGNNDGTFNPESNITRQDMMILAKKALEMKNNTTLTGNTSALDKFADKASISPYAVDSLAAMVEAGVVSGTGDNIQPKDNTTRAQAAVIICKILDLMK